METRVSARKYLNLINTVITDIVQLTRGSFRFVFLESVLCLSNVVRVSRVWLYGYSSIMKATKFCQDTTKGK